MSHIGCFTEFMSLELYAEVFESLGCLDKLEAFASYVEKDWRKEEMIICRENGADFYGLPRNEDFVELKEVEWE